MVRTADPTSILSGHDLVDAASAALLQQLQMTLVDRLTQPGAHPDAGVGDIKVADIVLQAPVGIESELYVLCIIVMAMVPRWVLLAKAKRSAAA